MSGGPDIRAALASQMASAGGEHSADGGDAPINQGGGRGNEAAAVLTPDGGAAQGIFGGGGADAMQNAGAGAAANIDGNMAAAANNAGGAIAGGNGGGGAAPMANGAGAAAPSATTALGLLAGLDAETLKTLVAAMAAAANGNASNVAPNNGGAGARVAAAATPTQTVGGMGFLAGSDLRQTMAGQQGPLAQTPQRGNTRRLAAARRPMEAMASPPQHNNEGAGANGARLPPPVKAATLEAKLRTMEGEQREEGALKLILKRQGEKKPADPLAFGNWLARVGEPVAMVGMAHDEPFVTILTSVVHYAALGDVDDLWDGKWMAAADDRGEDGTDPPFVRMKPSYWDWREVNLPKDLSDSGPVATYYDTNGTRGEFYTPSPGELEGATTWVPKFPLVPAAIARKARAHKWAPWTMYEAMCAFEADKSEELRRLLTPGKNWAAAASIRGNAADCSKMAYVLTPLKGLPTVVKEELAKRIEGTFGRNPQKMPSGQPPSFNAQDVKDMANAAITSMREEREASTAKLGETFQAGVLSAMRMFNDNSSDTMHKSFTDAQKARVMSACCVTKWCDVPGIWHEVEKCKSDEDLRDVLSRHWAKYETNLTSIFYKVYWSEELLKAIRKVAFTASSIATYKTSEMGLSMLQLLPYTEDQRLEIESEYQRRKEVEKKHHNSRPSKDGEKAKDAAVSLGTCGHPFRHMEPDAPDAIHAEKRAVPGDGRSEAPPHGPSRDETLLWPKVLWEHSLGGAR